MKKVFLFLLFWGGITMSGCSDESVMELELTPLPQNVITRAGGDGLYDVLGMSYDATISYLSDIAVKLPVIDCNKIDKNRIVISTSSGGNSNYYYGANAEDYVKDVVKKTNISLGASSIVDSTELSLFGGTLSRNNNLTSKFSYSSQYSFASHDEVFRLKFLRLNADIALLRQCLSQTFLEDLENYYPDQFVEAYGTHVLCDVSIGGRLSMIYRSLIYTETSSTAKTRIIKSGFNATIPKILSFNTSSDSEVTVTEIDTKKNEDWSLFVQSSGGRAINSTYTPAGGVPTIDLGAWQNSITERNAALVDIAWDKAIPIYELISDLNKREQIKQAVIRYIEKRKIDVLPVTPVYRSFSGWDHLYQSWYSPTYGEKEDWKYEGAYFSIFTKQISGTVPLCQYYGYGDHFYTTDYDLNGTSGRRFECIIGYVYPEAHEGAIPLYRAWNGKDHFYTTEYSPTYGDKKDYKYELIACYVLPLTD